MKGRKEGVYGEEVATRFLLEKGYTVLARRKANRQGEIDVVALDGETLVFVEVKLRNSLEASPESSVNRSKIQRVWDAAAQIVTEWGFEGRRTRFDLVAIDPAGLRHHVGALAA